MTTLIAAGTPAGGQEEAMGRYLQGALPVLVGAGGKPVKRLRVTQAMAGSSGLTQILVMDFDNAAALTDALASDAYQSLVADRDVAFSNFEMFITEEMA